MQLRDSFGEEGKGMKEKRGVSLGGKLGTDLENSAVLQPRFPPSPPPVAAAE